MGKKELGTLLIALFAALAALPVSAQEFVDRFDRGSLAVDPQARRGWAFFTGDGEATMTFSQRDGVGVVAVDATHDRRGIWWALIKRSVSASIDGRVLARPNTELRVEARVRSHTPARRVNLSVNHTRTTDFHSGLAEFDLPDTEWHVISFTTKDFDAQPRDEVFAQLALMDWGLDRFQVDIDYFKVSIVYPRGAPPDQGEPLPYRPTVGPLSAYAHAVPVAEDAIVDAAYPWVNFAKWTDMSAGDKQPLVAISGSQTTILRFDLSALHNRKPKGWGVLEITTENVGWAPNDLEEFGYLRVAEILEGDPAWRRDSVTEESFLAGKPRGAVLGQMFEDIPPSFAKGSKTLIQVSPPVLERLLSGRSKGIAIYAQGAVNAAFYSGRAVDPSMRPTLYFDVQ